MAKAEFSAGGFVTRWVVALALVMVTFNPTPWSCLSWLQGDRPGDNLPLKALAGVVPADRLRDLPALDLARDRPARPGPGRAVLRPVLWVLIDYGWLDPTSTGLMTWVLLVIAATVLAIGMSWSHVRRRMSGQYDVDDIDED